ncbi:hypothetical protein MSPP1_001729 [Malassezia sp. CBS 17886]|nr:hypothetical protein MSPP1_001729 [Malassezia sp. CBS 17886]
MDTQRLFVDDASFVASNVTPASPTLTDSSLSVDGEQKKANAHRRSGSFVVVKKMKQTPDQVVDQEVGPNMNAEWVNYKGAWVIHIVLILLGKLLLSEVPGISDTLTWTIVNLGYMMASYFIFHYSKGSPFDFNSGAYDELTLWEQIDQGYQYTPAKKYLTSLPIALFLLSTHYSNYDPWLFSLNLGALLFVLFPKLPILHRARLLIMPGTGTVTPAEKMPPVPTVANT